MKHYKEGRNHIFEFGEMSITRIKLNKSQYDELVQYFTQQQVKNCSGESASDTFDRGFTAGYNAGIAEGLNAQ